MCGIAAIFAYCESAPKVEREELIRLRDAMASRGPDGKGEWFSEDGHVAFGHRRLSIIDLSEKGAQPMASADGSLVVTFNGEIYNYKELRARLEAEGARFQSQSDTEVLLHLYKSRGEAMARELRGMFAFALWDNQKKVLWLVRDPYGIKPLYYADDGRTVRAASQVKALLQCPKVSRSPEPAGLAGFFLLGSVPEPYTLYQEIRAVPAGSFIRVDSAGVHSPEQYFSIAAIYRQALQNNSPVREEQASERILEALRESVRYHLVSDVPVGLFLSSGIDSGTIAGLAFELGRRDLHTVTLGFKEFEGTRRDETPLAGKVAAQYGTRHSIYRMSQSEFYEELPKIFEAMDQPTIDGVNIYFVSKAARALGLKVALCGLGGDELFGGYTSFGDIPKWVSAARLLSKIPFTGEIFYWICRSAQFLGLPLHPKTAALIRYGENYAQAYFLKRGLFMPWELPSLLPFDKEFIRQGLERLRVSSHFQTQLNPDPKNSFARVATLESSLYMRNQLLRDADWAGMAHGLEIRTPFTDSFLLRVLAPLTVQHKRFQTKSFLPEILKNRPPAEIARRAKTGFSLPTEIWLGNGRFTEDFEKISCLARNGSPLSRRWAYAVYLQQASSVPPPGL